MSEKRMFKVDVIDSDEFMSMPHSTQLLYFFLCLKSDDDGFCASPRKVQEMIGCGLEDLRILLEKRYILAFEGSGVIVIKHWRMHNTIRRDRYTPTVYQEELSTLIMKPDSKVYTERERHPELVDKENHTKEINDDWTLRSQRIWEDTFALYPKKYAEDKGRYEWEKLVQSKPLIEDRLEFAKTIYKAIQLYVEDYKVNSSEDTSFKFMPRFDNWMKDMLPVWVKRVK